MGFYENLRDITALGLIKQFGFKCFLRKITLDGFNAVTGFDTGPTYTDYSCYGVFASTSAIKGGSEVGFVSGSEVRITTQDMYLDASILKQSPSPGDLIVVGSDQFQVMSVTPTMPGNTVVVWQVVVKE